MDTVAAFAALAWERRAVTAALRSVQPAHRPGTWRGELADGTPCVVAQTGVGLARARQSAIAMPPARLFLVCGCAGALTTALRPGDVVVADCVIRLDETAHALDREPLAAEALLTWAAGRGVTVHRGPLATSPVVLADVHAKRMAAASGALVIDMETAAVAEIARTRGIPVLAIRVVLDEAMQALPLPADVIDAASGTLRAARALGLLLRPRTWPTIARLARQTQIAERALRRVLAALFGAGGLHTLLDLPRDPDVR